MRSTIETRLTPIGGTVLPPDHVGLHYAMSFEKVSLPAVILQKLLETK